MKRIYNFYLIAVITSLTLSCNMPEQDLDWTPSLLGPIFYSKANVKDLSDLENKVLTYSLPAFDLGFPEGATVDVPPLNIPKLGPQIVDISDYFIEVEMDSAEIMTSITNAFPIPIGAGTKVTLRSADDTSDVSLIYQYKVEQDIPPGGQYTVQTIFLDQIVPGTMYLALEDFKSPGGDDVVFTSNPAEFTIEVGFVSIKKIKIATDRSLEVVRTLNMNLNNKEADSTLQNGVLHINIKNEIPVNVNMQIYFLDQFETIPMDSMFDGKAKIVAGATDINSGISNSPTDSKIDIPINLNKINNWENSGKVRIRFGINTKNIPGSYVTAASDLDFEISVSGDLDIKLNLFKSN